MCLPQPVARCPSGVAGGLCRGPLGLIFLLLLGEHVRASLRAGHGTQEPRRGALSTFISVVSSFVLGLEPKSELSLSRTRVGFLQVS